MTNAPWVTCKGCGELQWINSEVVMLRNRYSKRVRVRCKTCVPKNELEQAKAEAGWPRKRQHSPARPGRGSWGGCEWVREG